MKIHSALVQISFNMMQLRGFGDLRPRYSGCQPRGLASVACVFFFVIVLCQLDLQGRVHEIKF